MMFPKPQPSRDKREQAKQRLREWQQIRKAVLERDGRRCRVCNSRNGVEVHHIRFRSLGGGHSTANCAVLCQVHHADIHGYRLALEGNANCKLKVVKL